MEQAIKLLESASYLIKDIFAFETLIQDLHEFAELVSSLHSGVFMGHIFPPH